MSSWSLLVRLRSGLHQELRRYAAAAAGLLLVVSLAACSADDDSGDDAAPKVRPTPITKFEAASVQPVRAEFCDDVPDDAVAAAVGDGASTDSYGNGDAARITGRLTDVAHEYSCTWSGDRGDVARAWVFAPRVTVGLARQLARGTERQRGCDVIDPHGFGTPSAGVVCTVRGGREASYRGLFVDTWLACSLTDRRRLLSEKKLVARAGQWCVQVAQAASG